MSCGASDGTRHQVSVYDHSSDMPSRMPVLSTPYASRRSSSPAGVRRTKMSHECSESTSNATSFSTTPSAASAGSRGQPRSARCSAAERRLGKRSITSST